MHCMTKSAAAIEAAHCRWQLSKRKVSSTICSRRTPTCTIASFTYLSINGMIFTGCYQYLMALLVSCVRGL